ncbi:MAG: hypothetical protein NTV87_15720 [Ignavibacteriae bacterium]|nr:hypothetical protein [Ignavibacteriota bacterium]
MPKSGSVTFTVFDISGREVAVLFNNAPLNAGTFEYKFNAGLNNGQGSSLSPAEYISINSP